MSSIFSLQRWNIFFIVYLTCFQMSFKLRQSFMDPSDKFSLDDGTLYSDSLQGDNIKIEQLLSTDMIRCQMSERIQKAVERPSRWMNLSHLKTCCSPQDLAGTAIMFAKASQSIQIQFILFQLTNLSINTIQYIKQMSDSQEEPGNSPQEGEWDQDPRLRNRGKRVQKKIVKQKKDARRGKGHFTSSTYRKEKCEFYNRGNCVKGDLCTYSHEFQPDIAKKICKFFLSGSCSKDQQCQYSHNTKMYPCKFYHIENRCNMSTNCRFSHSPIAPDFYNEYMKDNKDHILKAYKQNKLSNKNLIEFIEDDLPKKELEPPPIIPIIQTQANIDVVINSSGKPVKKDPRQRYIKPKTQISSVQNGNETKENKQLFMIKKEQQQKIKISQVCISQKFKNYLQQYFYSYY